MAAAAAAVKQVAASAPARLAARLDMGDTALAMLERPAMTDGRDSRPARPRGVRMIPRTMRRLQTAVAACLSFSMLAGAMPAAADPARAAGPCAAPGVPATAPRLDVVVTGARSVAGNVTFTLYGSNPAAFLAHRGSIALIRSPLSADGAAACFAVPAAGTYAVAVYHDENDNHHFDRTLIGLPAEGYGFSNDAPIRLGPPSFAAVRFQVGSGETRIAIRLRY